MSASRSKVALPALVVLLLLAIVGSWALLHTDEDSPHAATGVETQPVTEEPQGEPAKLAGGASDESEGREEDSLAARAEATESDEENFDTSAAPLLRGRVVLPQDAGPDASLEVLAVELLEPVKDLFGDVSTFAELMAIDDERRFARRPVAANLTFEVPVPSDAQQVALFLDGRFLHLEDAGLVKPASLPEELVLTPELGACVLVRMSVPADVELDGFDGVSVSLGAFSERMSDRDWSRAVIRRLEEAEDDGTVEFRGIRAHSRTGIVGDHADLTPSQDFEMALIAGKVHEFSLELGRGAEIFGRVVNEAGEPVEEAFLDFRRQESEENDMNWFMQGMDGEVSGSVTDKEGKFSAKGLLLGSWSLSAQATGLLPSSRESIELTSVEQREEIEIVLPAGASISGTVTWPDGSAAADTIVSAIALSESNRRGWADNGRMHNAKTDAEGKFRFTGLIENDHSLIAFALPKGHKGEVHDLMSDPAAWSAKSDPVLSGADDVALVLSAPLLVRGRVIDDRGEPVTEPVEFVASSTQQHMERTKGDVTVTIEHPEGRVEIAGLDPGAWHISPSSENYTEPPQSAGITLPHDEEITWTLTRKATITGTVTDTLGQAIAGAKVTAKHSDGQRNRWRRGGVESKTDAEGRFELKVDFGTRELTANHDDWAESPSQGLELAPGQKVKDIALVLRMGGTLTGEAFGSDGAPAANRGIQLVAGGMGLFGGTPAGMTDGAGHFRIEHLDPGAYQVILEPTTEETLELQRSDGGMEQMLSKLKMSSAEIVDGETTHVILGAPPKDPVKITGVIMNGSDPLDGGMLMVVAEGKQVLASLKPTKVGEDGTFAVTVDEPGDYLFFLEGTGGREDGEFFETIPEVEEYSLTFELPLGGLSGRVLARDGSPAVDVRVTLERTDGQRSALAFDGVREETDSNGDFSFEGMAPGGYAIRVGGQNRWGGQAEHGAVVVSGLVVEEDEMLEGIEIQLSGKGSLSGTVTNPDGTPVQGAWIFVRNESGTLISSQSHVASDATGKFTLSGVAPGEVRVTASQDGVVSPGGVHAVVADGLDTEVTLVVEPGTILDISAEDKEEKAQRIRISVTNEEGEEFANMLTGDMMEQVMTAGFSNSRRQVGPLAPGKYTVIATTADGRRAKKRVKLTGKPTRRLKLRLN